MRITANKRLFIANKRLFLWNDSYLTLFMVESGYTKVILPDGIHIIQPGYLYF
jgi:hypothetical protein